LNVQLDSELVVREAAHTQGGGDMFFRLRRLRQIRRHVGQELTLHLVLAYVITQLDRFNSLLAGLPHSSLNHYSVYRKARRGAASFYHASACLRMQIAILL